MPKYIIEREIPGSGALTTSSLHKIAKESCNAIAEVGPGIQWNESFVTGDKWYCVYVAKDENQIREHAKCGGFPINAINEVMAVVDPVDAEAEGEFVEQ